MKTVGRNDPCPCGSGKKFKKCCELKRVHGRLSASRITSVSSSPVLKASSLTSIFQNRFADMTPPTPAASTNVSEEIPSHEASLEEKENLLITS